ncbi:MAG: tRNA pseudouridine(38-40) synthase TruA [bacterium]
MRNIKLTIEYEGADFAGWQVQPNARTVQDVVQRAVRGITGETELKLVGSGRTDAGVHAAGQVANVHTETAIPAANLIHAINTRLPEDVAIVGAEDVPPDFHARYSAVSKTYRYTILNRPAPSPLERARVYLVRRPLDIAAMRAAAESLVGEHDFAALQSKPDGKPSVRTITRLELTADGAHVFITATADGFLYHMVRAIVGTLVEVGLGRRRPDSIAELVESGDRSRAGPTAPPQGLCLMEVTY